MLLEKLNILKSCIKSIVFNKENIVIEVLYPIDFKKNFPLIIQNDDDKSALFEDKYVFEIFTIEFDFFETFIKSLEQAILDSRDDIRKELLLTAQLKSLKGVGLNDVLLQKNIQLDEDIVNEILTMEDFSYEDELYVVWDKIMESVNAEEKVPSERTNTMVSDELVPNVAISHTESSMLSYMETNDNDVIMVTSMEDIEKDYQEFQANDDDYNESF